jgi:hypothetical protein
MECETQCTRCDLKWDEDFEYCPMCEPVLAQAERRGVVGGFNDQETADDFKGICFCAVHCPRSPHHERACCDRECGCFCHESF